MPALSNNPLSLIHPVYPQTPKKNPPSIFYPLPYDYSSNEENREKISPLSHGAPPYFLQLVHQGKKTHGANPQNPLSFDS